LYDFYGEYQGVRIARKHIGWYYKHQHGAEDFRRRINTVESARDQLGEVALFFDLLDTNIFAAA
jgi:tRNA-dihydrouridine synthase B